MWGLDLLGPFKKAPGSFTHLLAVVDKFTKWIEARPLAKIGSKQVVSFVQDIVFRFGVRNPIITDNGTQFTKEKFLDFYDNNNIWVDWAVVTHPRTNGQVEHANGLILHA
jgi:IS30 family transposase